MGIGQGNWILFFLRDCGRHLYQYTRADGPPCDLEQMPFLKPGEVVQTIPCLISGSMTCSPRVFSSLINQVEVKAHEWVPDFDAKEHCNAIFSM